MTSRSVEVRAGDQGYEVVIGSGLLDLIGLQVAESMSPPPSRVLLVADSGVPDESCDRVEESLAGTGIETRRVVAVAQEKRKSISVFEALHAEAARGGIDRQDALIALGGGIVCDLTGFVAATHRRGVRVLQCPTTLLAMVDASVGGKTGVNLDMNGVLLKNFVGAFHQPRRVVASVDVLKSLDDRQFRAGLAECIKHTMICSQIDPNLGDWTRDHLAGILEKDEQTLMKLVARNVAVKAAIVAQDEFETAESGGRALLNLGHTFGHAIETLAHLTPDGDPGNAPLLHGEAVALGLVAATEASAELGIVPPGVSDQIRQTVSACGLPTGVEHLPPASEIIERMGYDKKVRGGVLRVVLPTGVGVCQTVKTPPLKALERGIEAIRLG